MKSQEALTRRAHGKNSRTKALKSGFRRQERRKIRNREESCLIFICKISLINCSSKTSKFTLSIVDMACVLTSAGGIISLLDEKEPELQIYALQRLNDDSVIRQFWAEIADSLEPIEILYEDESFAARKLAALVASKVYFNLGSYKDSLNFALGKICNFSLF
jgi:hypothetical protein